MFLRLIDRYIGTTLLSSITNSLLRLLTFQLPLWVFVIAAVVLALLGIKKKQKKKPVFFDYTEEAFEGLLYRWEYDSKNGQWCIGKITTLCPTCRCQFVYRECQICHATLLEQKDRRQLDALIRYSIEKKYQIKNLTK